MSCTMPRGEGQAATDFSTSLKNWAGMIAQFRSQRAAVFGADLFYEPAWDILLHLAGSGPTDNFALSDIVSEIGGSGEATRRWLQILVTRGDVETCEPSGFRLSVRGRENLLRVMQFREQP